jgi:hypothetical protein
VGEEGKNEMCAMSTAQATINPLLMRPGSIVDLERLLAITGGRSISIDYCPAITVAPRVDKGTKEEGAKTVGGGDNVRYSC